MGENTPEGLTSEPISMSEGDGLLLKIDMDASSERYRQPHLFTQLGQ